jgi:hypothetical protein
MVKFFYPVMGSHALVSILTGIAFVANFRLVKA